MCEGGRGGGRALNLWYVTCRNLFDTMFALSLETLDIIMFYETLT